VSDRPQVQPVSSLRVPNTSDIDIAALRAERLARLQQSMRDREVPACLFFHPANIRYATGTSVMDVWASETFARHCLVPAEGDPVLFECHTSLDVSRRHLNDVRPAVTWQFMPDRAPEVTRAWAADLMSLLRELGAGDGPWGWTGSTRSASSRCATSCRWSTPAGSPWPPATSRPRRRSSC